MRCVAVIDIQTEQDIPRGWTYHVVVRHEGGPQTEHEVRLAWVDHDHWSGGRCPPSKVIEALFAVLIEHEGERPIPLRFDASTARRWFPDLDREVSGRV
jgi:hypothetical protein